MKEKKKFRMALSTKLSLSLMVLGLAGASYGAYKFYPKIKDIPVETAIQRGYHIPISDEDFKQRFNTQVFDKDGQLLQEFSTNKFEYIAYADMPKELPLAVIAIEDKRFNEHKGVDINAFPGIIKSQVSGGQVRGGSTITQQLAKNIYLSSEQTIERKATEMVVAQRLEKQYSKEQILEFYLNNVYFGHGAYGINTASLTYFNKPVSQATVYEMALMVGITNNPTLFDPVSNQENAHKRALIILSEMKKQGYLSDEAYEAAKNSPSQASLHIQNDNQITSYPVKFAVDTTVEKLMEMDGFVFQYKFDDAETENAYTADYDARYKEFYERVINGGYVIKTSIDQEKQARAQEIVTQYASEVPGKEATATVIDNQTNMVVAIVGGVSASSEFNRASQGLRQPGSSLKPYLSYGPALDRGMTPQSTISDSKGNQFYPDNWYTSQWGDLPNLTLTRALVLSSNRPAYRLSAELEDPRQPLVDMKFRGLTVEDNNPIISVGGFTNGVRNVDVAGAVNMLASVGTHQVPSNVVSITDRSNGRVLYERTKDEPKRQIFSPKTAHNLLKMMQAATFDSQGTGRRLKFGHPYLATKTGTTDNHKDLWSTGATPHYSLAVHTGHDDGHDQEFEQHIVAAIFRDIMTHIHQGLPHVDFELKNNQGYSDNGHKAVFDRQNQGVAKAVVEAKKNPLNEGVFDKGLHGDLRSVIKKANEQTYYSTATVDALAGFLTGEAEKLMSETYKTEITTSINQFHTKKHAEALAFEQELQLREEALKTEEATLKGLVEEYNRRRNNMATTSSSSSTTSTTTTTTTTGRSSNGN